MWRPLVMDKLKTKLALAAISATVLLILGWNGPQCAMAHGHSHDDGHGHSHGENPAFKYSRQANAAVKEDEIMEEDIVDLPPSHGPNLKNAHGHSHGGHGHSHGGHGHSHGGHGHSHGHGHAQREMTPEEREQARLRLHKNWDDDDEEEFMSDNIWLKAILATVLISLAPFVILFLFPLDNSKEKEWLLKICLSFACGGLLGDAFLHLIPHAMMASEGHGHSHSHGHGHSHGGEGEHGPHDLSVGLGVLSGIVAFLCVEKFVRIYNGGGHSHSHGEPSPKPAKKDSAESAKTDEKKKKSPESAKKKSDDDGLKDSKETSTDKPKEADHDHGEDIKVTGFLNLAADAFHNFTDGMAIGTSFLAGNSIGVMTTFMILFHEIPHEIGDYAILIQSGVKPAKAKMLQLLTALAAIMGCVVALFAQEAGEAAAAGFILPFTSGGFIYIATVSVIPELLEGTNFKQSVMEVGALLFGVFIMVVVAQYE